MKICFENRADDVNAILTIGDIVETVFPESKFDYETDDNSVVFSVVYDRDFVFKTDEKTDRLTKLLFDNIGNLIVQIKNTYLKKPIVAFVLGYHIFSFQNIKKKEPA